MRHIILAPDSYKGTLTAAEVCSLQKEAILACDPAAEVHCLPMADGGEGFTDAVLRLCGGERVALAVTGPMGKPVDAFYGMLPDGTAVIELAAAAGLTLVNGAQDPLRATTYGVGELICHAARRGASRILLGLGGSATNDGGIGMAAALGYSFYDADGAPVEALAGNLLQIARIQAPEQPLGVEVVAACDVNNPLYGPQGATRVFGPQKGVTAESFQVLEDGLRHLGTLMAREDKPGLAARPGAGAAGGMGAGVLYFLNGTLRPGVELLLDMAGFDGLLAGADLVITGEGCMDGQSVYGKAPAGVGLRCKQKGVACIAVCGSLGPGAEALYAYGIDAMFSTIRRCSDMAGVRSTCRDDMRLLMRALMGILNRRGPR